MIQLSINLFQVVGKGLAVVILKKFRGMSEARRLRSHIGTGSGVATLVEHFAFAFAIQIDNANSHLCVEMLVPVQVCALHRRTSKITCDLGH